MSVIALSGLVVTCLLLDTQFMSLNPAEGGVFFREINLLHDFLQRGSKAFSLMSQIYGILKNHMSMCCVSQNAEYCLLYYKRY
jgi:hypothetical protein